jgi:hypothetical protein
MNLHARTLVLVLVMGGITPVWAAPDKTYIKETVPILNDGLHFQVIAQRTLVEGKNATRYSIRNLFDHNNRTAWVTKFDQNDYDNNVATFEIDFDEPVFVQSITLQNGYQKSRGLFSANQRIRKLEVRRIVTMTGAETEADLTLKDTIDPQRISALQMWSQSANFFKTRKLIFFVYDVFPGARYNDLCLSGITIQYAKTFDYKPSRFWNNLRKLIEKNKKKTLHGWDWSGFDNADKYPQAFNDLLYYVLTGNKDAYAMFSTFDPESIMRSEDMNNFFRDAVNESLSSDTM